MSGSAAARPLLEAFNTLRSYEFSLGIPEYLLLQNALARGLGTRSRDDLIFLCQSLWGKSRTEQEQIRLVLEAALPVRFTAEDLANLRSLIPDDDEAPEANPDTPTDSIADPAQRDEAGGPASKQPTSTEEPGQEPAQSAPQLPDWALTSGGPGFGLHAQTEDALPPGVAECQSFNFEGRLPIPLRQIQRIWSYLRRMEAAGPSVLLDADATIEDIYRKGVLEGPVMVPRKVNRAKLLILRDVSESMAPFRRAVDPLIEAARSSGLSEIRVLYFQNELGGVFFADPGSVAPVNLAQLTVEMRAASLLVVSDAGVMRRRDANDHSVATTCAFLKKYKEHWPNRAWLNPTPIDRWRKTSAMSIRRRAPIAMYEYSRIGLSAAVERLRGKLAIVQRG